MTSLATELLRHGPDPNDSIWISARYERDWRTAEFERVLFDSTRNVVELQPGSLVFGADSWLPLAAVVDCNGTSYRADRETHRLLSKGPCVDVYTPIDCLGGHGWETGQFDRPAGVTIDCRGRLLVADSGNHRVQVIRPEGPNVVAILGRQDEWGRAVSGTCGGAMVEPVHAVCDPRTYRLYVADRAAGLVHVFDDRFDYIESFVPETVPPLGGAELPAERRPVALTIADDGSLWVLDAVYPRIMRMTTDGKALDDIGAVAGANPFTGAMALRPRYHANGEVVLGPLDSGTYDQSWHKVGLDLELPPGASVSVRTFATNEAMTNSLTIPWAPIRPVAITHEDTGDGKQHAERLILSDTRAWERHRHGPFDRARPDIRVFDGDGPSSSDTVSLTLGECRRLREGDTVEFGAGAVRESLLVSSITSTEMRAYAIGVGKHYGAGTEVWLVERGGMSLIGGRRLIHTLSGGESVDLSSAPMNDRLTDVLVPHSVGAVVRIGDRLELIGGVDSAVIEVESLDSSQAAVVTTNVAVAGDYSSSTLRLLVTPGRLVAGELAGFEYQLPREVTIEIDDETGTHLATVDFVEADAMTVWLAPGSTFDPMTWSRFFPGKPQATDKGQFLWIQLRLQGALRNKGDETAIATPTIHRVAGLTPRPSLLALMPAVYSRHEPDLDPVGALFLERYLSLFETHLTGLESSYEAVSGLLNIETTDEDWLKYLSTWMGLVLDPSWDNERRRLLLVEAMDLYQKRGTREGIERYLEIYTGNRPIILEGFQWRPASSMVLGRVGRLGCSAMKSGSCDYEPYAHRFGIHVFVTDVEELDVVEATVRNIIDSIKPAHTDYDLHLALPETRVGHQSRVGIDMVLRDPPAHPIRLESPDVTPEDPAIVGSGTLSPNPGCSASAGGPTVDVGGVRATRITLN